MRTRIYVAIFTLLVMAGFFSRFGYVFDLTTHFQPQYLLGLLIAAGFSAWKHRWKTMTVALLIAIIPTLRILPLYLPFARTAHADPSDTVKVLLINIKAENQQYGKMAGYIKETDPDIIALQEIDEIWYNKLKPILNDYPHSIHEFREDNFGIGLYSKVPVSNLKLERFSPVPSISGDIKINDEPVTILVTHPIPPVRPDAFAARNHHYVKMANHRPAYRENLVLIGDLNSSSWSYYFQRMAKDMGLRDSRHGFGLQFTWPTMTALLLTTIDHALVSENILVHERHVGQDVGSDHYPVFLEFGVKSEMNTSVVAR